MAHLERSLSAGVSRGNYKRLNTLVESFIKGFSDAGSIPAASTIGGVNEHPALYVCSTMFVLLLPLSAVR